MRRAERRRYRRSVLLAVAWLAVHTAALRGASIWIEGEHPERADVTHHGWYDDVAKDGMSGGQWLSHYDPDKPGQALYRFEAERGGAYVLWWRGNVLKSRVSYALNGGPFVEMDLSETRGEYMISPRPDHRNLGWVKVGEVELRPGPNTIALRLHSPTANHGGIDAFVFTNDGFVPSGSRKPAEADDRAAAPDAWFAVVFDDDPFSPESVIDMSGQIEAPAGRRGFLRRDGDALRFERAERPVKFWAVGANARIDRFDHEQQTQRIRYLRKHGVNMVRQHPVLAELGPLRDSASGGRLDPDKLDAFDRYFAELKEHGLYMTWSVFYPLLIGPGDGYDPALFAELPEGRGGLRRTYGLVNVERQLQDMQLRYLEALLLHRNPYTGLRYVDDPALAVLEFQNEDTVFFHNPLNDLAEGEKYPLHSQRLRQRWFQWVRARYGDEAAVRRAWGRLMPGDDWAGGELRLMGAFHLGGDGPKFEFQGHSARAGDTIRFLTDLQRGFYERREKELRDLGYRAVTVTTAWKAGGPAADPANLYADTAADMIDRHAYFGGGAGRHSITVGEVSNRSHLGRPGGGLLSIGMYQVEGRPFACTEWTQSPPNQWKAEAAPLMAFYGMGLQGWDAVYHFTNGRTRLGEGWPNLSSYVTDTPHYIGQFPALSFAVRHGHIAEAPVIAARRLSHEDLFTSRDPLKQTFNGYDVKVLEEGAGTPPEALAVGRVTVGFDGGRSELADLDAYWDADSGIVVSATGQLIWDYGRRVVTLEGPKTHAVIGFAGGRTFDMPGVSADIVTPFVSLLLTPLDDRPLAESRRILITAMARDKQTGARYNADGTQLLRLGAPPLLMEPVQARIHLKGQTPATVNVLDVYGVPTGQTVPLDTDGGFTINGLYRTYYYEIRR